jgi:NAD(P)-dependent dehydrogenase (short-subunit alcohol dehydrogenase family)
MKNALIIGGTKGIGLEIAKGLIREKYQVTIVGRDAGVGESQARNISATFMRGDVSSMNDVRRIASEFKAQHSSLDALVHSADVLGFKRMENAEGMELSFAINYLSRVLLNHLLLDLLKNSPAGRIIHIAAAGMPFTLNLEHVPPPATANSMSGHNVGQSANDLYGLEMAERLSGSNVRIHILHPGMVDTDIRRNGAGMKWIATIMEFLMRPALVTPAEYAKIPLGLLTSSTPFQAVLVGNKGNALPSNHARYGRERRVELWRRNKVILGFPD